MIIGGMVVLTILAFLLINFFSGPNTPAGPNSGQSADALIDEIEQLESSILELEVVFEEIKKQEDIKTDLLEEKRDEINKYTQQIEELEKKLAQAEQSGQVNQSTINRLRSQLEELKTKSTEFTSEFTRFEVEMLYMDNKRLLAAVDSFSEFNSDSARQARLEELEDEIAGLKIQLIQCDESSGSNSSAAIPPRGETLVQGDKISEDLAARLATQDRNLVDFTLYNEKSRKKREKLGIAEKANSLETLQVQYNITDRNIESFLNGKEMFLRIVDPKNMDFTSANEAGHLFTASGQQHIAADKGIFGTGSGITFQVEAQGGEWKAGGYQIQIFSDGRKIGTKNLVLN